MLIRGSKDVRCYPSRVFSLPRLSLRMTCKEGKQSRHLLFFNERVGRLSQLDPGYWFSFSPIFLSIGWT